MSGHRARRLTIVWWAGLAGTTVGLHLLGTGVLGPPPLLHPQRIWHWWEERGAVLATFAAAREALWWVGCYLWVVWTAGLLARWTSSARLTGALSRCRLPGARAAAGAVFGVSAIGAALVAGAAPSFAAGGTNPSGPSGPSDPTTAALPPATGGTAAPVLHYLGAVPGATDAGTTPVLTPAPTPAPASAPVLRYEGPSPARPPRRLGSLPRLPRRDAIGQGARTGPVSPSLASPNVGASGMATVGIQPVTSGAGIARSGIRRAAPTPTPTAPAPSSARWTVRPGDDLWSIAEATLSRAWGHVPTQEELARYWWQVVEINRPYLPNPSDPNLLFPGDQVAIPVTPAPSTSPPA